MIINELLCYMLAKIGSVPTDTLTRLVKENFSDGEIDAAKTLLKHTLKMPSKPGTTEANIRRNMIWKTL